VIPRAVKPGRAGVVLAAAALAIAGCGEDDDSAEASRSAPAPEAEAEVGPEGGGPEAEADLTVEAHDVDFDRDEYRLAPGEQRVSYVQEGDIRHTLLVETTDGAAVDGFVLEVDDSPSDAGTVDLEAGRYTFYCDVAGHREAGMEAALVVE
jgi:plastocyanin